jgi:Sulfotransferase domain
MLIRRLTRSFRAHLPDVAISTSRSLAIGWGKLTASLRMDPTIVVIGAQRSGTTTLFRLLEQHPSLVRPTLSKGTGYFDDGFRRGFRWYKAHFPMRLTARVLKGPRAQTFEISGYYIFHPLAAERMARALPNAQIVALLRDPVERTYSAYRHEYARGFEDLGFADALALEDERTAGEAEKLASVEGYVSYAHRHHAYRQRSEYSTQLERYVRAFGRDRVHIVDAELFFADPAAQFVRLQKALGLEVWHPVVVERWNARAGDPLSDTERDRLLELFEPYDEALAQLMSQPPSWRSSEVTA